MTSHDKRFRKRLKKGEAAAFAELYDELENKIYRYIFSQIGNSQDTADVTQEVFVQLVKSHRVLGKAENTTGYVFRVARNEVIRWLQKQKRHRQLNNQDNSTPEQPTHCTELNIDSIDWIKNVLEPLEPIDREIVSLKAISKLTFAEIAEATGLAGANVASRYRRSMLRLKQHLTVEQPASPEAHSKENNKS